LPTIAQLTTTVSLDDRQFRQGMAAVNKGFDSVGKKAEAAVEGVEDTNKALKDLGKTAKQQLAVSLAGLAQSLYANLTKPLLDATKAAVGWATDIQESVSKVDTLFGKSGREINAWSKTTATALGLTRREALAAAGDFGNLFRSMGFGQAASAGLSKDLIKLAADLASFNNTSVQDAIDALRSGLVGESEPLRRFGVNLNEAALKAEALRMGLIKTEKEGLSPATKAAATYAVVLRQTAIAQGDMERTGGSLSNQTKKLQAEFEDFKTELATQLLPVVKQAVEVARGLLLAFRDLPKPVQNLSVGLVGIAGVVGPLVIGINSLVTALGAAKTASLAFVAGNPLLATLTAIAAAAGAAYIALKQWESRSNAVIKAAEKPIGSADFIAKAQDIDKDIAARNKEIERYRSLGKSSPFSIDTEYYLTKTVNLQRERNRLIALRDNTLRTAEKYRKDEISKREAQAKKEAQEAINAQKKLQADLIGQAKGIQGDYSSLLGGGSTSAKKTKGNGSRTPKQANLNTLTPWDILIGQMTAPFAGVRKDIIGQKQAAEREIAGLRQELARTLSGESSASAYQQKYPLLGTTFAGRMSASAAALRGQIEAAKEEAASGGWAGRAWEKVKNTVNSDAWRDMVRESERVQGVLSDLQVEYKRLTATTDLDRESLDLYRKTWDELTEAQRRNVEVIAQQKRQNEMAGVQPFRDLVGTRAKANTNLSPSRYFDALVASAKEAGRGIEDALAQAFINGRTLKDAVRGFWQTFATLGAKSLLSMAWDEYLAPQIKGLFGDLGDGLSASLQGIVGAAGQVLSMGYGLLSALGAMGGRRKRGGLFGGLLGLGLAAFTGGASLLTGFSVGSSIGSALGSGNFGEFVMAGLSGAAALGAIHMGSATISGGNSNVRTGGGTETGGRSALVSVNGPVTINSGTDLDAFGRAIGRSVEKALDF
jgi:hypothetical protein